MKGQNLFCGKNKESIISLSSAELARRVVNINCEYCLRLMAPVGVVILSKTSKSIKETRNMSEYHLNET